VRNRIALSMHNGYLHMPGEAAVEVYFKSLGLATLDERLENVLATVIGGGKESKATEDDGRALKGSASFSLAAVSALRHVWSIDRDTARGLSRRVRGGNGRLQLRGATLVDKREPSIDRRGS
jgi:hypothetical protein